MSILAALPCTYGKPVTFNSKGSVVSLSLCRWAKELAGLLEILMYAKSGCSLQLAPSQWCWVGLPGREGVEVEELETYALNIPRLFCLWRTLELPGCFYLVLGTDLDCTC